ncbi:MAG: YegP family protein [Flavobacteriales bacterium]|nr:YegP family protein [Flavobacteriales bacterium]
MMANFEVYTDKAGQTRFRLKAGNGEIILKSEGYTTRRSALNGVASVKKNALVAMRFERKETKAGSSFNLKATNGQVVGTSEVYNSAQARDKGIASVQANAPKAEVKG